MADPITVARSAPRGGTWNLDRPRELPRNRAGAALIEVVGKQHRRFVSQKMRPAGDSSKGITGFRGVVGWRTPVGASRKPPG